MILFLLGIRGILPNKRNIIIMPTLIGSMPLTVNLNFSVFSVYLDDMMGQSLALLMLTMAVAESAIGLAKNYRRKGFNKCQSFYFWNRATFRVLTADFGFTSR